MKPSQYFRRQVYSTFWYEEIAIERLLDKIGVRNVMFETDIPHAVCLYPNVQEHIVRVFSGTKDDVRRRVLQDNAAELYRIDVGAK
jgi:predicted TIM-barrel fold metal-dependent hydrolase